MPFRAAFSPDGPDENDDEASQADVATLCPPDAPGSDWDVYTAPADSPSPTAFSTNAIDAENAADDADLASLDAEIASVEDQISTLQQLRESLVHQRVELVRKHAQAVPAIRQPVIDTKSESSTTKHVDFTAVKEWPWSQKVKRTMLQVWGIKTFRSQQEGVVNAVLSGRDVMCIMPTGAGKSLCFQLPALLSPGTTIVVSPLISLMSDQVMNLRDVNVEAVALTSSSSKQENDAILRRLAKGSRVRETGAVRVVSGDAFDQDEPEIKLCYVTPERLAKSKTLLGALSQMNNTGRLARFVIDESHCVSQMGHDYRPDYRKVSMLRQLYPWVPIIALTATCPPRILDDVLKILQLRPITDGHAANAKGTVLFRAPLYRPNLHWSVLPKPSNAKDALQKLAGWIIEHHKDESGIIYTLSQKNTEEVAEGLRMASENAIKTGVYHAGLDEAEKERVHHRWREKKIRVIVATIAFGMGIDSPDVRFVCHHTLSKSLEGLYQEAGRAGRDGKDADCVVFYRNQDHVKIASMLAGDPEGASKLHSMLAYAQDLQTCRKLLFSRYFAGRSTTAFASANGSDKEDTTPCTHCDNCLRDPDSIETIDVRLDAWRILKILAAVRGQDGRVTGSQLADLARGLGGGSFTVEGGKGKAVKGSINVVQVAGAKIGLNKEDAETLVTDLMLKGYIRDLLHGTAYAILVYQQLGPNAARLTRLSAKEVEQGAGPTLHMVVPARGKGRKKPKTSGKVSSATAPKKRKKPDSAPKNDHEQGGFLPEHDTSMLPDVVQGMFDDDDDDGDNEDEWENITPAMPPVKRSKNSIVEISD